jgi:hypothetical protein
MIRLGSRWKAAFTNAICDKACGKFPVNSLARVSYSSDSMPTSFLSRNNFRNSFFASRFLPTNANACTRQKLQARNAPCRAAFRGGPVALQQAACHQLFFNCMDSSLDARIGRLKSVTFTLPVRVE